VVEERELRQSIVLRDGSEISFSVEIIDWQRAFSGCSSLLEIVF
jgi:hypothetical protein